VNVFPELASQDDVMTRCKRKVKVAPGLLATGVVTNAKVWAIGACSTIELFYSKYYVVVFTCSFVLRFKKSAPDRACASRRV
jgi:hypothetical protein